MTSYSNYGSEVIGQGEAFQITDDGRYHETLSSAEEAGAAVIVNWQVPKQQGEEKKYRLHQKLVCWQHKYDQIL